MGQTPAFCVATRAEALLPAACAVAVGALFVPAPREAGSRCSVTAEVFDAIGVGVGAEGVTAGWATGGFAEATEPVAAATTAVPGTGATGGMAAAAGAAAGPLVEASEALPTAAPITDSRNATRLPRMLSIR